MTFLRIVCGSMPCSALYSSWLLAAPVRLADRVLHRVGHLVRVHDDLPVDVPCRATDHLDEARRGAQEPFLVRVEDRDERDLGQVEALPEQVDADQHVVLAEPQRPEQLDPFERVDLAVQVADADARARAGSR